MDCYIFVGLYEKTFDSAFNWGHMWPAVYGRSVLHQSGVAYLLKVALSVEYSFLENQNGGRGGFLLPSALLFAILISPSAGRP